MSQYKIFKRLWLSLFGLPTAAAGGVKAVQALLLCNRHELATHVMRHNFRLNFPSLGHAYMCVIANKLVKICENFSKRSCKELLSAFTC